MAADTLISIITITYNAANEILPTLVSLREQTYKDFEYLVIDGASRDNTIELVRENAPEGARIISEPDRGLYDAMNKGLRNASGRYILFLNAGDAFAAPYVLAAYAEAALTDPDVIYGDTMLVNSKRRVIAPRHLSAPDTLCADAFSHGMTICHQAFMVRRDIAPEYNTAYRFSADFDWCIRCMKAAESKPSHRYINLHTPTIHYLSEGLTTRNKWASLRERFNIMRHHYGTLTTTARHIGFIARALKRGHV